MIEVRNVTSFTGRKGRRDRAWAAQGLVTARAMSPLIERKLPIPAEGYRDFEEVEERLKRIAGHAGRHKLSAFVVIQESDDAILGMATAQVSIPRPNTAHIETGRGVELAYWLGGTDRHRAVGEAVVDKLLDIAPEVPSAALEGTAWMVTLPQDPKHIEDFPEVNVCYNIGLKAIGQPQPYSLGDNVTEPRQLWTIPYGPPFNDAA